MNNQDPFRSPLLAALLLFVLASLTGTLFRFGIAYGLTGGLSLVNIRHAHSHLMYMGWATPALFILIASGPERALWNKGDALTFVVRASLAAAAAAYPLFLFFGYSPVTIGAVTLPPAVIASGLNILCWYGFAVIWTRSRTSIGSSQGNELIDGALILLVLSTAGAWALSLLSPLSIEGPVVSTALKHVFLDLFSEGWFVLGTLGVMYRSLGVDSQPGSRSATRALVVSVPFTFLLGMPESMLAWPVRVAAGVAGTVAAAATLVHVRILWRALGRRRFWLVPLIFLTFKASALAVVAVAPAWSFAGIAGLRILYLHAAFLGFVTLTLATQAIHILEPRSGRVPGAVFSAAVCLVLLTLLPLSSLWPAEQSGRWTWVLAAWTSLGPPLTALVVVLMAVRAPTAEHRRSVQ